MWRSAVSVSRKHSILAHSRLRNVGVNSSGFAVWGRAVRYAHLLAVPHGLLWAICAPRQDATETRSFLRRLSDTRADPGCFQPHVSEHAHMVDRSSDRLCCHDDTRLLVVDLCR